MPFAPRIQQLSLVLLVTVLFLLPLPLAAQVFDLSLSANKSTFNARDRVVITAESNSVDLETADIEWVVNNTPLSRGVGLTSQPIVLGVVGESTEVTVSVYEDEDVLLTTSTLTIAPATVSIHWESNGYTNPFYRGRALATPGTEVTVEARAFFVDGDGNVYPPQQLYYTWSRNNRVDQRISGLGASYITLRDLPPHNDTIISVSVSHPTKGVRAENQTRIPSTAIRPLLYPVHPVLGIDFSHAVSSLFYPDELEKTFALIPQFAPIKNFFDNNVTIAWFVNGVSAPAHSDNPTQITLIADSLGIAAKLKSRITPNSNFSSPIEAEWGILFDDVSTVINDLFSAQEQP